MVYKNLVPGQWQIGEIVMGYGTNIKIESVDVKPYDVTHQDYQVARSSEKRFGFDQFSPTTIELNLMIMHNRLLPGWESLIPNFWHSMPTLNHVAREWRFDEGRNTWGEMKALYVNGKYDEIPKVVYGRPGQFSYTFDDEYNNGEIVRALAEFRRADTLAYSVHETGLELELSDDPVYIIRNEGDGPDTWFRILIYGPVTNPVITVGEHKIKLNVSIPEGKVAEVSSYPWKRRAVDSDRINLAANLVGDSSFLDRLTLPYKVPVPVKWTSTEANTWVPSLGNQSWSEDIGWNNLLTLPDTFETIHGKVGVHFDFFNFGSNVFPWITPRMFLGAGIFSDQSAILYTKEKFNTPNQRCEARIVEPFVGKSGIVIMSNETMTNFACVVVEKTLGGQAWIHICSGAGYNNLTVRDSWQNPDGWSETDRVGIEYDPATQTYTALLNGDPVDCTWADTTSVVNTANRNQGFLFDIDGNLLTRGIGFSNIIAYDTLQEPVQTGRVVLVWQDSYSVI